MARHGPAPSACASFPVLTTEPKSVAPMALSSSSSVHVSCCSSRTMSSRRGCGREHLDDAGERHALEQQPGVRVVPVIAVVVVLPAPQALVAFPSGRRVARTDQLEARLWYSGPSPSAPRCVPRRRALASPSRVTCRCSFSHLCTRSLHSSRSDSTAFPATFIPRARFSGVA